MTDSTPSPRRFFSREEGATLVEYALVLALIVIGCITVVSQIGNIAFQFLNVGNSL